MNLINHYRFNMEGAELLHKAMNVGYNMLMGDETPFTPNDSDEVESHVKDFLLGGIFDYVFLSISEVDLLFE